MMQSLMGGIPSHAPQFYAANTVADEYTRRLMMAESARRSSRASNGYRPTNTNTMRVTKPGSTSTSPQSLMARRRTLVNDNNNMAKRRQYALQQMQMAEPSYESYQEPAKRSGRPVSWHPSTQFQQPQMVMYQQYPQQLDYSQYMMPNPTQYTEADIYAAYQQLPSTPAIYSGHTSPVASLSPVSLPYTTTAQEQLQPQYVTAADTWGAPAQFDTVPYGSSYGSYESNGSPNTTEPFPSYTGQSTFTWDTSSSAGYNPATPPTPETFQPVSQPEPVVPLEEPSLHQAEEESEEEGEILIGMGLYDTPDKSDMDPQLDHYRTSTSSLLGSTYRKGAGLKLEEAWEPPKEEEDDEEDAESEEEE
ncbi:hypothetical protein PG996_015853 [Apiospora saccharicola]|uniref:Uncharacterized protein n=1 Tax=Apiospora saccharicola TaxID=335842 RepID=A0ABR1TMA4_9PEZI